MNEWTKHDKKPALTRAPWPTLAMFFVHFDLVLWPSDPKKNGLQDARWDPVCVKFGDPSCIGFWDIVLKMKKQTDRQTNDVENRTHMTANDNVVSWENCGDTFTHANLSLMYTVRDDNLLLSVKW